MALPGIGSEVPGRNLAPAPPRNPWRTHCAEMLRLKIGVGAGALTSAALICSTTAVAATYLFNSGATAFGVLAAVGTWFALRSHRAYKAFAEKDYVAKKPGSDVRLQYRAEVMLKELCRRNNRPEPEVIQDRAGGAACLIDRRSRHDFIILNPDEVARLSDPELRCVLAHELAHSNHFYTRLRETFVLLNFAARPALLVAGTHFLMTSWGGSGSWGQALAFVPALLTAKAAQFTVLAAAKLVWNIACRSNESEADLRAVSYTGDPEAAQSLFKKFAGKRHDLPDGLLKLMDHPLSLERVNRIRRWFRPR